MNSPVYYRNRKERRERLLRKLANARAAKARRLAECPAPDPEPHFVRSYPLEFGLRDKRTGESVWTDFKSVRDTAIRLTVVRQLYV